MDRLISENLILSLFDGKVEQEAPIFSKTMTKIIKRLPSAYKGMTNGGVIRTVFPNADIKYRKNSVYVTISPLSNLVIFDKDWWNSPYKEEQERSDKE